VYTPPNNEGLTGCDTRFIRDFPEVRAETSIIEIRIHDRSSTPIQQRRLIAVLISVWVQVRCFQSLCLVSGVSNIAITGRAAQYNPGLGAKICRYGTCSFTTTPRHNSHTLPGPSGCLGLWVSQCYKRGPLLSHHVFRNALSFAFNDSIIGLYTDDVSAPLNNHTGLRRFYKFGLYSHCAYVNETAGLCSKASGLYVFQPYKTITNDMPSNYSDHTNAIIHNTTFSNSILLGGSSHIARRFLLSGVTAALMALIMSV